MKKERTQARAVQGSNVNPSPLVEGRGKNGFPRQSQEWPGRDLDMQPRPDHGEDSYQGAGKLVGRVALITGGDSGIGRAIAIAFAREGANVALSYYNEHEDAGETIRWIEEAGRRVLSLPGDLRDPAHCRDVVERVASQWGRINILVNNAAFHQETPDFMTMTPEQLDRTFQTNVFACIWLTQAALVHMTAGDAIINTGSIVGEVGHPKLIDYAATKAAIVNITKSLAIVLAPRGIRVNCVAPGPVWTPLITSTRSSEAIERFGVDTLWKRAAQPAEIAPSYVYFASADSRYCTGETLGLTGIVTTG